MLSGSREGKIIIFHNGALGDFLLACPVFEGLSYLLKKKVFFCTRREYLDLVRWKSYYSGFLPGTDTRFVPFFDDELWKNADVPEEIRDGEEVFVFGQRKSREFAIRLGKRLKINKCFWISSFPEGSFEGPVRVYLAKQLERLGYPVELKPFYIEFPSGVVLEKKRCSVVIHPGSGSIKKVWPFGNWLNLIECIRLNYRDTEIKIVFGPAEERIREHFCKLQKIYGFEIISEPGLLELAALIKQADLFIGNDSGVSHLAASSGTYVVVIFGPTSPDVWAPFGERVVIIRDRWTPDEVLNFEVRPHPDAIPDEIVKVLEDTLVNYAVETGQN